MTKKPRAAIAIALMVTCVTASASRADPYSEFVIPDHHWSQWAIDFAGNGRFSHFEQESNRSDLGGFAGRLATRAVWSRDSDRLQHLFAVSAGVEGRRDHLEESRVDTLGRRGSERTDRDGTETLGLGGSVRVYPRSVPVGIDLNANATGALSQRANDEDAEEAPAVGGLYLNHSEIDEDRSALAANARLAVGVGRVRDATGVYRTQLLEQRLLATGNLERPLADATREKLAALFYIEPSFRLVHDKADKFFWREIERLLREDGALGSRTLDAYAVFRLLEPAVDKTSIARPAGFFIGPSVSVSAARLHASAHQRSVTRLIDSDTLVYRSEGRSSASVNQNEDIASVGAVAEYHRPIGRRWQADVSSAADYSDEHRDLASQSQARLAYVIADRWLVTGNLIHLLHRSQAGRPAQRTEWTVQHGASLSYYLEDAWQIGLTWDAAWFHTPDADNRNAQIRLGISYLIAGRLEAPGIIEPARPLRENR